MRIAKNLQKAGLLAGLVLCADAAYAATTADAAHCSGGLELRLSTPQAAQGNLILAQLQSKKKALREVTGKWIDRSVYFWAVKAGPPGPAKSMSPRGGRREALLGVDLEKPPGTYELSVSVTAEDGTSAECRASLEVTSGKFATEKLTVEKKFVEPNEQQASRAVVEQKKLRELFEIVTPEKLWQGPFRFPLTGVTKGTNFGKRRILNGQPRSPHTGADFPAPTGTPIHATQGGRVVLAEELYFSGNTVIVNHGLGVYSLYGHLSATDVGVGDDVKAGAILGKVGATGRVTGPHLHWGITVNKARVNPVRMVSLTQRSPFNR